MTRIQICESPAHSGKGGRALVWLNASGCGGCSHGRVLSGGWLSTENRVAQELTESVRAFLIRIHGRIRVKAECTNYLHQKITGRQPLPVPEIRRVRVCDSHSSGERLVRHCHISQYGACVTLRQRVEDDGTQLETISGYGSDPSSAQRPVDACSCASSRCGLPCRERGPVREIKRARYGR